MSATLAAVKQQYFLSLKPKRLHPGVIKEREKIISDFCLFTKKSDQTCHYITDIRFRHVHHYLLTLHRLKASTYNLYLSHIKSFLRYAEQYYEIGLLSPSLQKKREDRQLPKNIPLPMLISLCQMHTDEKGHLLSTLRNQVIIEFLVSTGVRSIELRDLLLNDLSHDLTECRVSTAKGGNSRVVFLGIPAREALIEYLNKRDISWKKNRNDFLFPKGKNGNEQMQATTLYQIVTRLSLKRIGFSVSPHMIRHTFATEMLRATGCLRSVQEMLGHVNINNTAKYCHLNYQDTLTALNKYHPHGIEHHKNNLLLEALDDYDD